MIEPMNPPPEPTDPAARRREKLLAFHLGALEDPEEIALLQGRLESDPEWQKASAEAQAMLKGLAEAGSADLALPGDLGERTALCLQEDLTKNANLESRNKSKIQNPKSKIPTPAPKPLVFAFSPRLAAAVFLVCALPALWLAARYIGTRPAGVSMYWRAESELSAGAPFAPCLVVRDAQTKQPVEGVRIAAALVHEREAEAKKLSLGEGLTGPSGALSNVSWRVPELAPGKYRLLVEAHSASGTLLDRTERDVRVGGSARLVLAPDRSQARPGEMIRARALLVSSAGERPLAEKPVALDLFDPLGNRIARRETNSSRFGLAWAEFPLDEQAPEGDYKLVAESGGLKSERAVAVKQYRLPPFRVSVTPARPWFGERDRIRGRVEALTFDGHPLAGAKGEFSVLDLQGKILVQAEVALDSAGVAVFDVSMPPGLWTPGLDVRPLRLDVKLTDPAGRAASGQARVNASRHAVLISAVPEAGELVQGLENRVYLVARRPDGSPVRGKIEARIENADAAKSSDVIETDEHGVAVLEVAAARPPAEVLRVSMKDEPSAAQSISLPVRPDQLDGAGRAPNTPSVPSTLQGRLLLRTDKAVLRTGERLAVSVLLGEPRREAGAASPGAAPQTAFATLALRQDGRTIAAGAVTIQSGRGQAELSVPEGASGVLALEATLSFPDGRVWTDRRAIFISGGANLKLSAAVDRAGGTYKPGETAHVAFQVTNASGQGRPAAVSVVAVDRALLALTGENPGLAQALAAAGMQASVLPGFPLVPAAFTPEEGSAGAAHAALAAVRTGENGHEKSRDGDQVVDTSAAKLSALAQAQREEGDLLRQFALGLAGVGLVLLILLMTRERSKLDPASGMRFVQQAVPLVTLTLGVAGMIGAAKLGMRNSAAFVGILAVTLIAAHGYLFSRIYLMPDARRQNRLLAITAVTDLLMAVFALILIVQGKSGESNAYAALLGISALFSFPFQYFGFLQDQGRVGVYTIPNLSLFVGGIVAAFCFAFIIFVLPLTEVMNRISDGDAPRAKAAGAMKSAEPGFEFALSALSHERGTYAAQPIPEMAKLALANENLTPSPRLRWDFPETLLFVPQVVTDEDGRASLDVPLADSLTEWTVQADAIAAAGGTAWTACALNVTQPFSVDLTLPTGVTAGDTLTVPAVVSNHAAEPRKVRLELELTGAQPQDGLTRELTVAAHSVAATEFSLRFEQAGTAALRLQAKTLNPLPGPPPQGGREVGVECDAVERLLPVLPEGRPMGFAASGLIQKEGELAIAVPEAALAGTIQAQLTLHRGPLTQMLEGLEAMLREPHGCFEQTSSSHYPNVMVLRYLKAHGIQKPGAEARARNLLACGYQRLLGFEIGGRSGSFSLYGQAPASPWLTAYGLKEFTDMAAVYPVDPALLERIRNWLTERMNADGSFPLDGYHVHEQAPQGLAATAYVVWALGERAPVRSVVFLRDHVADLAKDAYTCALGSLALLPHDRATAAQLAGKLRSLAQLSPDQNQPAASLPAARTLAWGYGNTASVEASALGALALLETGQDLDLARRLLAGLQGNGAPGGGWGSTQATVLALQALERAASTGRDAGLARVVVELDGRPLPPVSLPAEEAAAPFALPLVLHAGAARLRVKVDGGPVAVRVTGEAHVPWTSEAALGVAPLQARVSYDAVNVERGQAVLGTLELSARGRRAEVPMVEWGLPAGFEPEAEGLDALKAQGVLARWERSGRTLRLYLPDLAPDAERPARLAVRFFAMAKGELQAQAGKAYEYYRRDEAVALQPAKFQVK